MFYVRYGFLLAIILKPPFHPPSSVVKGKGNKHWWGFPKIHVMDFSWSKSNKITLIRDIFGSRWKEVIFGIHENNSYFSHNIIVGLTCTTTNRLGHMSWYRVL